jgi:hypothetical protein
MSSEPPSPGDVYEQELLDTRASYRVVTVEDDHVTVEAVEVPGLERGHRLRLTRESLVAMARVEAPVEAADPAAASRSALPDSAHPRAA